MDGREDAVIRFDEFTLDFTRRRVCRGAAELALRPKCFDVLAQLARQGGRVLSRDELTERVWPGLVVSDESLSRCVSDLRQALGDRTQRVVKTVPSRGYVLAVPVLPADAPPAAAAPAPLTPPGIAVLPFDDLSAARDLGHVTDGLTEDLTSALARLGGFAVVARNTMAAYRGRAVDVRTLAGEHGARYVVEGSVRRHGRQLRATVQLLDAVTGMHRWAGHRDEPARDPYAAQDAITAAMVGRLGTEVLAAEYERTRHRPPQGLDAWECVLRALFHSSQQSEADTRTALQWLARAREHDPSHAQALGIEAWIRVFRAFQGWDPMPQALPQAQALVAQALAHDNDQLWPQLAQGMVAFATRDTALALRALRLAVQLHPYSVNAHGHLGIAHAFCGQPAEALACIARAMQLSPRDTYLSDFELYNAFALFAAARHDEALSFALQARRLRPGHAYPVVMAAACAGQVGDAALGRTLVEELRQLMPGVGTGFIDATAPFVREDDRARLVEGLRRAGLGDA
ncbi:MAG: winged helix-turn-helix domain-containing protein [Rubrivivax sp.]